MVAAVQAFFPLLAPVPTGGGNGPNTTAAPPARPPATLTAWAVRAGNAGPALVACAAAALPMPASPADAQIGPPVRMDLSGCGPAVAALVFGLSERTAFFDAPNAAFLSDSYFALDDLAVCAGGGTGVLPSVAMPPPSVYLQSPPLDYANKRRRRRRLAQQEANTPAAAAPTAAVVAGAFLPSPPLPGSAGAPPPPPRPGYVAGQKAPKAAEVAAVPAAVATALTTAPKAGSGVASAAARASSAAAAAGQAAPSPACFSNGFDALSWRPTVNRTLDTDAYVSFYKPLEDGSGLAWVNLAVVKDAAPPPAAVSAPLYGRPRFPGPVYAFSTGGAFRPLAVSVAPLCQPGMPGSGVDAAACPGPPAPPPVFEVAALKAGGADGVSGARLEVCATAALGLPPAPPADASSPASKGVGTSGDPSTIDLAGCGDAVLALRFRLVPPFPGRELSWGLDDLVLCPAGGRLGSRGGGRASVRAPEGLVELPVVDPPAWPGGA